MMEWYQILSYFLTNSIRGFFGLYLVCGLLSARIDLRRIGVISAAAAAVITALPLCSVSDAGAIGTELVFLAAVSRMLLSREKTRMSLFLLFFYEIASALWEFIISCVYAVAFRAGYLARWCASHQAMDVFWSCLTGPESSAAKVRGIEGMTEGYLSGQGMAVLPDGQGWMRFLDRGAPEHLLAVWTVRLFMLVILISAVKKRGGGRDAFSIRHAAGRKERRKRGQEGADPFSARHAADLQNDAKSSQGGTDVFRTASAIAVTGMICVVTLGSQTVIAIPEDELSMWTLFSVILMFSVLVYNLNSHYEAEKEIVRLKEEQAELLDRDYQSLNRLYSENARLFHDLHNHIELLHRYLTHGNVNEAVEYLEDLRGPVREITNSGWTGDEAVDYLIGTKTAAAQEQQIAAEVNMEYPRHTNIRSADLTAILGNLLDNALEAAKTAQGNRRFIRLTVRRINDMLVIKVENGCDAPPVSKQGELISAKTEGGLHGWGLKSVRAAAEKYDGIVETMYEDHVFRAVVTLSFEAVNLQ